MTDDSAVLLRDNITAKLGKVDDLLLERCASQFMGTRHEQAWCPRGFLLRRDEASGIFDFGLADN